MLNLASGYERLLVAVSGGGDSIALMHLLHAEALENPLHAEALENPLHAEAFNKEKRHLHIATVNHGLRTSNETAFVAQEAAKLGLPCSILNWEGEKPTTGLQEAAREARYHLLIAEAKAQNCTAIVTAHTQDDQAETLLMRLLRGSGAKGMAGMQAQSHHHHFPLLRPLLWVTRQALRDFLHAQHLPFIEDPSNDNPQFTRVRMRAFLAQEACDSARLARFAARLTLQNDALATLATRLEAKLKIGHGLYKLLPLLEEPFALTLTFLLQIVADFGDKAIAEKLEKSETLAVQMLEALATQTVFHATLRGAQLTLTTQGVLTIQKALPRRALSP
jgi:tRNA(Ile)-lysidine synthase